MSSQEERVQRIKEYVLARLRAELATGPRGAQAGLAKKLGVSGAHLSNMLSASPTRQPGEDFRRKVAAHWGMSYAQLEAQALGEESPPSSTSYPKTIDGVVPEVLSSVLATYDWLPDMPRHLRALVREQALVYARLDLGVVVHEEWQRILTGLEREALAHIARRLRTHPPPEPQDAEGVSSDDAADSAPSSSR